MALFAYLLRRSLKGSRTPKKPTTLPVIKNKGRIKTGPPPVKGRSLYKGPGIVKGTVKKKGTLSSVGGDFFASLIGSSTPGAKKMQFPFENIPPVSVNVGLEPSTRNTLLSLGGMVLGGVLVGGLLRSRLKTG
jgi:hypothetical protein